MKAALSVVITASMTIFIYGMWQGARDIKVLTGNLRAEQMAQCPAESQLLLVVEDVRKEPRAVCALARGDTYVVLQQ